MQYQTVEVELEHGQVRTQSLEVLPAKARALLTILEAHVPGAFPTATVQTSENGLRHFLDRRDFPLTPEQFQTSMAADFWEQ